MAGDPVNGCGAARPPEFGGRLAHLDAQRLAGHALERRGRSRGRPRFELDVAAGAQTQQVVVAAVV